MLHARLGSRLPPRRGKGMTLLEVQVSALVAALVFAGLALTLSAFGQQLGWLQSTTYYKGKVTPVGIVTVEPETIIPGESLAGKYTVDVRGLALDEGDLYVLTVHRRAAATTDCGRQ